MIDYKHSNNQWKYKSIKQLLGAITVKVAMVGTKRSKKHFGYLYFDGWVWMAQKICHDHGTLYFTNVKYIPCHGRGGHQGNTLTGNYGRTHRDLY